MISHIHHFTARLLSAVVRAVVALALSDDVVSANVELARLVLWG